MVEILVAEGGLDLAELALEGIVIGRLDGQRRPRQPIPP